MDLNQKKIALLTAMSIKNIQSGLSKRYFKWYEFFKDQGYEIKALNEEDGFVEGYLKSVDIVITQPDVFFHYSHLIKGKIVCVDLLCFFFFEHELIKHYDERKKKQEVKYLKKLFEYSLRYSNIKIYGHELQKQFLKLWCDQTEISFDKNEWIQSGIGFDQKIVEDKAVSKNKSTVHFFWYGTLWDWYDPILLLKAFKRLVQDMNENVHLTYLSGRPPFHKEDHLYNELKNQIKSLSLNSHVTIIEDWIPEDICLEKLQQADVFVSCFKETEETKYSFRIRNYDCLLLGIPMVTSNGDIFSELIKENGWGEVALHHSENDWFECMKKLLNENSRKKIIQNINSTKKQFEWNNILNQFHNGLEKMNPSPKLTSPVNIDGLNKEKQIYIYGASKAGKRVLEVLKQNGCHVQAFIDSDQSKWGQLIDDIPVQGIDQPKNKDAIFFIIASFPGRESIEAELIKRHYKDGKDFIWFGQIFEK